MSLPQVLFQPVLFDMTHHEFPIDAAAICVVPRRPRNIWSVISMACWDAVCDATAEVVCQGKQKKFGTQHLQKVCQADQQLEMWHLAGVRRVVMQLFAVCAWRGEGGGGGLKVSAM